MNIKPLILLFLLLILNFRANSQDPERRIVVPKINTPTDTIPPTIKKGPEIAQVGLDSINSDSIAAIIPKGDIETTVIYSSRDSIHLNMRTRVVDLYGKAKIDYNPIALEADEIKMNWDINQLEATGRVDSTGKKIGAPIFKNGAETYQTKDIKYNFKTEKAIISGLVTQQGDGIVHGDEVFKNAKGELLLPEAKYTTCNLAHPHFMIRAKKVKLLPNKTMIAGPFHFEINDVPLPLGFAFGMFPNMEERTSGVIFPTYGEERNRGFFLKDGGYYFALNDYVNLALTGNIYTKGGYGFNAQSAYFKRYAFRGNFNFSFTKTLLENEETLIKEGKNDFRLTWSFSPQNKSTGRFSANVNMASSSYNKNNILSSNTEQARTNLSSSVSYSKSFAGTPFSLGLSGRFNQNLATQKASINLPDINFNVQNIYPLKNVGKGSKSWYNKIVFRYGMTGTNSINNQISTDSIVPLSLETLPELFQNASNGMKHTIPISTSFKFLKHFTVSPSASYTELWYFKKLDHKYDPELQTVVTDTINGFNRANSYSLSAGMNTRIYGTYFFNRKTGIQAIRHVMNPSISYSYRPDFGDPSYDYWQEVQINEEGDTQWKSRYDRFVYGQPSRGKSSAIGFGIGNTLEIKVKSKKDTTDTSTKIPLLKNFRISNSYNMAADSFNLGNFSLSATTSLLNNKEIFGGRIKVSRLDVNFSGRVNPYVQVLDSITYSATDVPTFHQHEIDEFTWNNGQGLGSLTNYTVSFNTGLSGKSQSKAAPTGGANLRRPGGIGDLGGGINDLDINDAASLVEEQEILNIIQNPDLYIDFTVPWQLNLRYNLNVRKVGLTETKSTQTLTFSGNISLTENWKVTGNSGYDLEKKIFTQTRFGFSRNLHCWNLALDWIPFGNFQSYNFTIRANSSLLQDLKLTKKRTFNVY